MALTIEELKVKLSADIAAFEKGMKQAADSATGATNKVESTFSALKGPLTAIGVAAVGVGASIAALTKQSLDAADELGAMAQQAGISTDFLQEMQYAASQLNVDQGILNQSLQVFNRTLGDASLGEEEATKAFSRLGISIRDSSGSLKSSESVFNEAVAKLEGIKSSSERASIAQDLFGRGGLKMANFAAAGSAELDSMRMKAQELGLVLDQALIQKADETNDKLNELTSTIRTNLSNALLTILSPAIDAVAGKLTDLSASAGRGAQSIIAMFSDTNPTARAKLLSDSIEIIKKRIDEVQDPSTFKGSLNAFFGRTQTTVGELTQRLKEYRAELEALNHQKLGGTDSGEAKGEEDSKRYSEMEAKQAEQEKKRQEAQQREIDEHVSKMEAMRSIDEEKYQADIDLERSRVEMQLAHMDQNSNAYLQTSAKLAAIDKKSAEDKKARDKATAEAQASTLNWVSGLQNSKSKEMAAVGKAAAIASTTISTYEAAQKAFSAFAGIPLIGPALGAAAAAAAVAAGLSRVASISGTDIGFNQGVDKVPGVGFRDTVPARLTPGERVVKRDTNEILEEFLMSWQATGGAPGGTARVELVLRDGLVDLIEAKMIERGKVNVSLSAG